MSHTAMFDHEWYAQKQIIIMITRKINYLADTAKRLSNQTSSRVARRPTAPSRTQNTLTSTTINCRHLLSNSPLRPSSWPQQISRQRHSHSPKPNPLRPSPTPLHPHTIRLPPRPPQRHLNSLNSTTTVRTRTSHLTLNFTTRNNRLTTRRTSRLRRTTTSPFHHHRCVRVYILRRHNRFHRSNTIITQP
ncbi:hypothetical protein HanPI659440_Chr14g0528561 [Helianthus annuus]|nr:hypothetical protein HanPI659440_Chr14g0528561 [Helianthus annuus]